MPGVSPGVKNRPNLRPGVRHPAPRAYVRRIIRRSVEAIAILRLQGIRIPMGAEAFLTLHERSPIAAEAAFHAVLGLPVDAEADFEDFIEAGVGMDAAAILSGIKAYVPVGLETEAFLTFIARTVETFLALMTAKASLEAFAEATARLNAEAAFRDHLGHGLGLTPRAGVEADASITHEFPVEAHFHQALGLDVDATLGVDDLGVGHFIQSSIASAMRAAAVSELAADADLAALGATSITLGSEADVDLDAALPLQSTGSVLARGNPKGKLQARGTFTRRVSPLARLRAASAFVMDVAVKATDDSWVNRTKVPVVGTCFDTANHNNDRVRVLGPLTIGPPLSRQREGLVKFKVVGYPNSSSLTRAFLRLTFAEAPGIDLGTLINLLLNDLSINLLASESWAEGTVTCGNAPNESTEVTIQNVDVSGTAVGDVVLVELNASILAVIKDRIAAGQTISFNLGTDTLQSIFPEQVFYDHELAESENLRERAPTLILEGLFLSANQTRSLSVIGGFARGTRATMTPTLTAVGSQPATLTDAGGTTTVYDGGPNVRRRWGLGRSTDGTAYLTASVGFDSRQPAFTLAYVPVGSEGTLLHFRTGTNEDRYILRQNANGSLTLSYRDSNEVVQSWTSAAGAAVAGRVTTAVFYGPLSANFEFYVNDTLVASGSRIFDASSGSTIALGATVDGTDRIAAHFLDCRTWAESPAHPSSATLRKVVNPSDYTYADSAAGGEKAWWSFSTPNSDASTVKDWLGVRLQRLLSAARFTSRLGSGRLSAASSIAHRSPSGTARLNAAARFPSAGVRGPQMQATGSVSRTGARTPVSATGSVAHRSPAGKGRLAPKSSLRAKASGKASVNPTARFRAGVRLPKPRATAAIANRGPALKGRLNAKTSASPRLRYATVNGKPRANGSFRLKGAPKVRNTSRGSIALTTTKFPRFVAVQNTADAGGQVMTSDDGITWTKRIAVTNNKWWQSIAYSPTLHRLVAVGSATNGANNLVMTSDDGIKWTARATPNNNSWKSVVWSPGLARFVAVASDGTGSAQYMWSDDGITWSQGTSIASGREWSCAAVFTDGTQVYALPATNSGDGVWGFSADGKQWDTLNSPPLPDQNWKATAVHGATFRQVAVSFGGGTTRAVSRNASGGNWDLQTTPTPQQDWYGLAYSPSLNRFVAVGSAGASAQGAMTSGDDGLTWTLRTTPAANQTRVAVAWSPALALFCAVGLGVPVMTSPDGITWTARTTPSGDWLAIVATA